MRVWQGVGVELDQASVLRAGFKHLRGAGIAARFEIHRNAHVLSPGMFSHERRGPQQTILLPIGEQQDKVVTQNRPGTQRAQGFEDCGHARAVVGRSGPGGHRIVVRREQDRIARAAGALQSRDDIFHRAGNLISGCNARCALDSGRHAELGKFRSEIVAHAVVLTCADWMWPPREIFQIDRRAFGGKLRRWRGRRHRRRWPIQEEGRGTCRQHEHQAEDRRL